MNTRRRNKVKRGKYTLKPLGNLINSGAEANYDLYDLSGWGPDYGDPQTYLDTMLDGYAGYMVKCLGIF